MISVRSQNGQCLLYAEAFVEQGERAVGVVLYEGASPIATLRLDEHTVQGAIASCIEWMVEYDFDDDSGEALIEMVTEELGTLETIRRHGPDIANDWLGGCANRRLPEL